MKIILTDDFIESVGNITDFIAEDSIDRAIDFHNTLFDKLDELDYMPYKFRKSLCYNDNNIRDFIFKGYVAPYFIDESKDIIVVLDIFKENLPKCK